MRIEMLIFIYGTVCVALLVFNTFHGLLMRFTDPNLKAKQGKLKRVITKEIQKAGVEKKVSEKHLKYIYHKMKHINNLVAFDKILDDCDEEERTVYLSGIRPVALRLSVYYLRRETSESAYFTYFLYKHLAGNLMPVDSLQDIILEYMKKDHLYCRINSLLALYSLGKTEDVLTALHYQDDDAVYLNPKILTEGLLSFTGNHDRLIREFWNTRKTFSNRTQLGFLNYIRFQSGKYGTEMYAVMTDEKEDKELRLAAIRYFGKYPNPEAEEVLIGFARDRESSHWEYATVSVSSLARYPSDRVIGVLKEAIHSSNWHIRYAASGSLDAHYLGYQDLMDVLAGSDRYAREIMQYRLESHKLQTERM